MGAGGKKAKFCGAMIIAFLHLHAAFAYDCITHTNWCEHFPASVG